MLERTKKNLESAIWLAMCFAMIHAQDSSRKNTEWDFRQNNKILYGSWLPDWRPNQDYRASVSQKKLGGGITRSKSRT